MPLGGGGYADHPAEKFMCLGGEGGRYQNKGKGYANFPACVAITSVASRIRKWGLIDSLETMLSKYGLATCHPFPPPRLSVGSGKVGFKGKHRLFWLPHLCLSILGYAICFYSKLNYLEL
jgi:hypothetical protein